MSRLPGLDCETGTATDFGRIGLGLRNTDVTSGPGVYYLSLIFSLRAPGSDPRPVPAAVPQQPPQDADTDGSSQDCVILHVVDVAAHDMAELLSPPRLTKH